MRWCDYKFIAPQFTGICSVTSLHAHYHARCWAQELAIKSDTDRHVPILYGSFLLTQGQVLLATKPPSGSFVLLMSHFSKLACGSLKQVTATYPVSCPVLLGLWKMWNRCGHLWRKWEKKKQAEGEPPVWFIIYICHMYNVTILMIMYFSSNEKLMLLHHYNGEH